MGFATYSVYAHHTWLRKAVEFLKYISQIQSKYFPLLHTFLHMKSGSGLYLIVSTVGELRVRIRQLDNSINLGHLLDLLFGLYQQIKIHLLFDIFENIHLMLHVISPGTQVLNMSLHVNFKFYPSRVNMYLMHS